MIDEKREARKYIHTAARTGYPSIDKPRLKYYSEELINLLYGCLFSSSIVSGDDTER